MNRLARVLVELPNHWAEHRIEGLWARQVASDLYELEDVPFFAYDLNFRDVVRTIASSDPGRPVVREVVRRGGHTTLRVVLRAGPRERERREALLAELRAMNVVFESWSNTFFALDVGPEADLDAVLACLEALEADDVLGFETCEARRPGSFDG